MDLNEQIVISAGNHSWDDESAVHESAGDAGRAE